MLPEQWILFVEDDSKDAHLVMNALINHPALSRMAFVKTARAALDYLFRRGDYAPHFRNPTVAVVDLHMPDMDGLELIKNIRATSEFALLPIVVFASSRSPSDMRACYQAGANGYVYKPLGYQEFNLAVRGIVSFWAGFNESSNA